MEKIKIYVTSRIADILEKDAEGFEFFKSDGRSVNKNALLTKLIVNYYNGFAEQQNELLSFFKGKIKSTADMSESKLNDLCFDLCEKLNERSAAPNGEKFDRLVSLKPTKESEPIIEYIERYNLMGRTLSEYFRSMLASYVALPQDKREHIIFKEQYEALTNAIREKKRVFITTRWSRDKKIDCAPYEIAHSKEELHCYVLVADRACSTIRLSRIVSVTQLAVDSTFSPTQIQMFERMKALGPQFIYKPSDKEVKVELTAKGIEKFKKIYIHRPMPIKVVNNHYYFDCANSQIVQYFVRFGEDAKIIYPQSVRDEVYNFHRRALDRYAKQNNSQQTVGDKANGRGDRARDKTANKAT